MSEFKIGCHLSSSKGFLAMGKEAVRIGANTFQFFTRNPRGGKAKDLDMADVEAYQVFAKENGLFPMLAHAPYTLNCAAKDAGILEFARNTMCDDLDRLSHFEGAMYNFHPGSHVGQGEEKGIELIAESLNIAMEHAAGTRILLETMAGKGSEVGRSFESLAAIIDRVEQKESLGVCLDTCHVYDAGYDIVDDLEGVLEQFDRILGLERLCAIHLNDSKNPFASHKDRHACIGEGSIPVEAVQRILNHPALRDKPFYLETPQEDNDGYAREIAMLKALRD